MKSQDIHFSDWVRILFGTNPASFFIEVTIRVIVVYLLLLVSMRLMGKRMSTQLSRDELAAMVSLAAAIGVPIMSPDRGLLPAIVIAIVVVVIERIVSTKAYKDQSFEKKTQGNISILVNSGVMQYKIMKMVRIPREGILAMLRVKGVKNLGEVKRLYIEAGGNITLIRDTKPRPGLSIIPDWDTAFADRQPKSDHIEVCCSCGKQKESGKEENCTNCNENNWVPASTFGVQEEKPAESKQVNGKDVPAYKENHA